MWTKEGRRVTMWDRPEPSTSQRRAFALCAELGLFVWGGNRSGKSEGGAMLAVAAALGRDHPDVQAWAEHNGVDVSWMQRGPGRVWASALTANDSLEYVRPKLEKYLPKGTTWRARYSNNQATAELPGGGVIVCKMVRQGREAYQGSAINFHWFDEEPDDAGVWDEALMRLTDFRGRVVVTATPLRGRTFLYRRYVKTRDADFRLAWLHGEDNPYVPRDVLRKILGKYSENQAAARRRGEFTAPEGMIYPMWSRRIHVVRPFLVPHEWDRYQAWDFGTRNPTAVLWAAVEADGAADGGPRIVVHDCCVELIGEVEGYVWRPFGGIDDNPEKPVKSDDHACDALRYLVMGVYRILDDDDRLHIFREHYRAGWTIAQHAREVQRLERGEPEPDIRFADHSRTERLTLAVEWDMPTAAAKKQVQAGIDAVSEWLRPLG